MPTNKETHNQIDFIFNKRSDARTPRKDTQKSFNIDFEEKVDRPSEPKAPTPEFHVDPREFNARYAFGKRDALNLMAKVGYNVIYVSNIRYREKWYIFVDAYAKRLCSKYRDLCLAG